MTAPGGGTVFFPMGPTAAVPAQPGAPPQLRGAAAPGTLPLPPEHFAPWNSRYFFKSAEVALVGGGSNATPAGLQVKTLPREGGVLKSVLLLVDGAGTISTNTNVIWQILINNVPVPGLDSATVLGRTGVNNISNDTLDKLAAPIPANSTLSVLITNNDGAAYTLGAQIFGWIWPLAMATPATTSP